MFFYRSHCVFDINDTGKIIESGQVFDKENQLIDGQIYKFIYKGKMASGTLVGKGTYAQCQDILNIVGVYSSKKGKV